MRILGRTRAIVLAITVVACLYPADSWGAASDYGIASLGASLSTSSAGEHPDMAVRMAVKTEPGTGAAYAGTKSVELDFPAGLTANIGSFPVCPFASFSPGEGQDQPSACPVDTQVGIVRVGLFISPGQTVTLTEPLYNLGANGSAPARLGFLIGPLTIGFHPRTAGDFGFTASVLGVPDLLPITSIETVTWGVPSDSAHDTLRLTPGEAVECGYPCTAPNGFSRPSDLGPVPLMTNPTRCGPLEVVARLTSYALPGKVFQASAPLPPVTGCEDLAFDPFAHVSLNTRAAASPTGLDLDVGFPESDFTADLRAPAALRKAVVELPEGFTVSTAAAAALSACSESEVGFVGGPRPHFEPGPDACPRSSRLGEARVETPVLGTPLRGTIYLAEPGRNPSRSTFAAYVVLRGEGVSLKLSAALELNPATGRVKMALEDLPQQPFTSISIHLGGPSGADLLSSPSACGTFTSRLRLISWAGQAKEFKESSALAEGPNGGACPEGGFSPRVEGGSVDDGAGKPSAFLFRVLSVPGDQSLARVEATLPRGLTANLRAFDACGNLAAASSTCPSSSRIGSLVVASGVGDSPLFLTAGGQQRIPLYLAGGYQNAPLSVLASVPVRAGPFDFGTLSLRASLFVNPRTSRLTLRSSPLPQFVEGVPIDYRELRITLDKRFIVNPTSCRPLPISSRLISVDDSVAARLIPFQVRGCRQLPFRPRAWASLEGSRAMGSHPRLRFALRQRTQEAAVGSASILLGPAELLDIRHIRGVCSRPAFAAGNCRDKDVYGRAFAELPSLKQPLSGPIYLVSSRHRLPDLVASLRGQVEVQAMAHLESKQGRIRARFGVLPGVPVKRLVFVLWGGQRGFFVSSEPVCRSRPFVSIKLEAENGKELELRPRFGPRCPS